MTVHEFKPTIDLANPIVTKETPRGGKLLAALLSWWRYRVRPPLVPSYLREDLGLPAEPDPSNYEVVPPRALLLVLWRS